MFGMCIYTHLSITIGLCYKRDELVDVRWTDNVCCGISMDGASKVSTCHNLASHSVERSAATLTFSTDGTGSVT